MIGEGREVTEEGPKRQPPRRELEALEHGVDELNLAEFPLAAISDRFLDGTKTIVFEDTAWDYQRRERVPRKLTISGSDRYGLPTAKDDDVLLACVQLSALGEFASREVHFSRYELLKLLRWRDETRNYRRLSVSLRRWKGLTVYSNRAFYDHARKSWVNRDFGVFDNLYVYEREAQEGREAPPSSWFVWNEVLYESFQAGYLKRLDWDLYCRLESPVAKRLYRFLDKRFYHGSRVEIDLHELAFRKVRLSASYNTGQVKRSLLKGIRELEACWEIKPLEDSKRFQKLSAGKWLAVFERRKRRATSRPKEKPQVEQSELAVELTRRQIGPAVAEELVASASVEHVRSMVELFDWYNARGQERGPGFLVQAIKNPGSVARPPGFESAADKAAKKEAEVFRKRAERDLQKQREAKRAAAEFERDRPFLEFWASLPTNEQQAFESEAVRQAEPTKRAGYFRSMGREEAIFEQYRRVILRDHFARTQGLAVTK